MILKKRDNHFCFILLFLCSMSFFGWHEAEKWPKAPISWCQLPRKELQRVSNTRSDHGRGTAVAMISARFNNPKGLVERTAAQILGHIFWEKNFFFYQLCSANKITIQMLFLTVCDLVLAFFFKSSEVWDKTLVFLLISEFLTFLGVLLSQIFPQTALELNGVFNSSKKQSLFHHLFLVRVGFRVGFRGLSP